MTTYLTLFVSSFLTVFLLVFQQKNVSGNHYIAAFITSLGIGSAQIFLWRLIPTAGYWQIIAALCGGPFGIIAAMAIHPRIMTRRKPQQEQP